MGATKRNGGRQQKAQQHGETQHGRKTTAKIAETWNNPPRDDDRMVTTGPRYNEEEIRSHNMPGKHRMFEGRVQHDEADMNSEKTRLARDAERHKHIAGSQLAKRSVRSQAKRKS